MKKWKNTIIIMMNDSILSNDFQLYKKVIDFLTENDIDDAYEDAYEDSYSMEKFQQKYSPLKSGKIINITLDNTKIQNKNGLFEIINFIDKFNKIVI